MGFSVVLFDLDHTLLDSAESERMAYEYALGAAAIPNPWSHFKTYAEINRALWGEVEAGVRHPDDVRVPRFARLVEQRGLDADAEELAADFVHGLSSFGQLYPGARPLLDRLSAQYQLGLVTNGIGMVQRGRIARLELDSYFTAISISGELGMAKPAPEIFDHTLDRLGNPERGRVMMVGDSLSSDIAGGRAAGVATCWFNPSGHPNPRDIEPDHEVTALQEVEAVLHRAPGDAD